MTQPSSPSEAIDRLAVFFANLSDRTGILARRALGRPTETDAALTRKLIEEMHTQTRMDGSLRGGFVATAWRVLELLDLGADLEDTHLGRLTGWLLARQNAPGAYSEGCTKPRHAQRACEHFIGGFFAPATPAQRVAPLTLPDGTTFRSERAARFATSCLALRGILRAGCDIRPAVRKHLASLLTLADGAQWSGYHDPDLWIFSLHALVFAPPPERDAVPALVRFVASHQQSDGTWPGADSFATLAALSAARTPEAIAAVRRAIPALLARQRGDGSFGPGARLERALIGLGALLLAA